MCYDRIHGLRKRGCESGIPLAYLEGLDGCYRTFLARMKEAGVPVCVFDWREFNTPAEAVASAVSAALAAPAASPALPSACASPPAPSSSTSSGEVADAPSAQASTHPAEPRPEPRSEPRLELRSRGSDEAVLEALRAAPCARAFEGLAPCDLSGADALRKELSLSQAEQGRSAEPAPEPEAQATAAVDAKLSSARKTEAAGKETSNPAVSRAVVDLSADACL